VEIEVANAIFAIVVVVVVTGPSLCALCEKVIYYCLEIFVGSKHNLGVKIHRNAFLCFESHIQFF
jgi:hypothetical protein